ncbi:unnamed protein product, partial [Iphiclides podalirius]
MPIIQSCCCWRSLRRGCYASAIYTMVYFAITIITMGHFIDVEHRYLSGEMTEPESESFLEPDKITPITVSLNITLLACSTMGLVSCVMMVIGVYKDIKYLLLPWIVAMGLETLVEVINLIYLFYLQTLNFNPITSFLFTLDFFLIVLNIYAMVCVISQFQEYMHGRGTAAFDYSDRFTRNVTTRTSRAETRVTSPRFNTPQPLNTLPPPVQHPVAVVDLLEDPWQAAAIRRNSRRPPQRLLLPYFRNLLAQQ